MGLETKEISYLLWEFQKNNAPTVKPAHLKLENLSRLTRKFLKLFQFRPGSGWAIFWGHLRIGKAYV